MEINKAHKMWVVIDTAGNADVHTIRPTRKASEGAAVRNRLLIPLGTNLNKKVTDA